MLAERMGCFGVRKGAWTEEEDVLLRKCSEIYGEGKWHQVPLRAGLNRCRKSCRLRWMNYLRPGIKRGGFAADEIDLIVKLHKLLGNKWSLIAGRLPSRTANDIKNYWNSHLGKQLYTYDMIATPKTKPKLEQKRVQVIKPHARIFNSRPLSLSRHQTNQIQSSQQFQQKQQQSHQQERQKQQKQQEHGFRWPCQEEPMWWNTIIVNEDEIMNQNIANENMEKSVSTVKDVQEMVVQEEDCNVIDGGFQWDDLLNIDCWGCEKNMFML